MKGINGMDRSAMCVLAACISILCSCAKPQDPTTAATTSGAERAKIGLAVGLNDAHIKVEATNGPVARAARQYSARQPSAGRARPRMPSEELVIQSEEVSAGKVGRLIRSEKFDAFVDRLSSESNRSPLAQDATEMERKSIEEFFGDKGRLRNFACGTSVCAGTIAMGKDASAYRKFSDHFLENGPANASLLDYPITLDNGEFEQRFVMSVDPDLEGITIPVRP
jgi:hypothetical protein